MTTKDKFLLALVLNYKHGDPRHLIDLDDFARKTGADYEEVEDIAAELKSEGSIIPRVFRHSYRLTDSGYAKYRARVEAIETMA